MGWWETRESSGAFFLDLLDNPYLATGRLVGLATTWQRAASMDEHLNWNHLELLMFLLLKQLTSIVEVQNIAYCYEPKRKALRIKGFHFHFVSVL